MALNDTAFAALAEATLNRLADSMETLDEEGKLDVECISGVLTVELNSGRQFVVSKHVPSQQIWLSSPLSGGLHFSYDEEKMDWLLEDGRRLSSLLKAEIETLLGTEDEEE